jgi:hypothetical protein
VNTWFIAEYTIRQRKLSRCIQHNSAAKRIRYSFTADNTIRQRKLIRCRQHNSATKLILCVITQFLNK